MIPNAIAVANGKGGCGKTSLVANMTGLAALTGWRVLAVELDSQGNLGLDYGLRQAGRSDGGEGLLESVRKGLPVQPIQEVRPRLDVVPAGDATDDLVAILTARAGRDRDALRVLEDVVSPIALGYDLVVFDSPPQVGPIQDAALIAAHYLVIPTTFDEGSIDGLTKIAKRVSSIRTLNPDLELLGVVLFNFAARATVMTAEVRRTIADGLGEVAQVLDPPIRSAPRAAYDMRKRGLLAHEYEAQADSAVPWYEGGSTRYSGAAPTLAGDYQRLTDALLQAYRSAVLAATAGDAS